MIHRNGIYSEYRSQADASEESAHLETHGYVMLPRVFTEEEVAALKEDIDRVFEELPADGRSQFRSAEEDNMFRYEMFNRSAVCQRVVGKRAILDVIEPLIGEDCHIIANTAWRNEPGPKWEHGGGGWHIDAGPHIPLPDGVEWPDNIPHPVFAVGVHIYLMDCGMQDGPTGVIPGSHLSGRFPPRDHYLNDDLTYNGVGVVPLLAKAGDVAMFVSDAWHRRMPTTAEDRGRYFLQVHYGRRDIAQRIKSTSVVNHLSEEALERATTDREKELIGIHPNLFYDG